MILGDELHLRGVQLFGALDRWSSGIISRNLAGSNRFIVIPSFTREVHFLLVRRGDEVPILSAQPHQSFQLLPHRELVLNYEFWDSTAKYLLSSIQLPSVVSLLIHSWPISIPTKLCGSPKSAPKASIFSG